MPWFRESEIRHGHTAILVVVGFIATNFVHTPGDMYTFEAIPKTINAHDALLKTGTMHQIILWVGGFDLIIIAPAIAAAANQDCEPGGE
jgi:hypothetical protein